MYLTQRNTTRWEPKSFRQTHSTYLRMDRPRLDFATKYSQKYGKDDANSSANALCDLGFVPLRFTLYVSTWCTLLWCSRHTWIHLCDHLPSECSACSHFLGNPWLIITRAGLWKTKYRRFPLWKRWMWIKKVETVTWRSAELMNCPNFL